MGQIFEALDDALTAFLAAQHMFFVATAPSQGGHVNLSPKGYDTFRVLDPTTVAYLDLTGSGVETIAHLRQNGRITLLFCAFTGPPKLVRLYGRGEALLPADAAFAELAPRFSEQPGTRAIVRVHLDRIATSCGYSVPLMAYEGERDTLTRWASKKTLEELVSYRAMKNARSIDGLLGLPDAGESLDPR